MCDIAVCGVLTENPATKTAVYTYILCFENGDSVSGSLLLPTIKRGLLARRDKDASRIYSATNIP
jgi:hypothetical protein